MTLNNLKYQLAKLMSEKPSHADAQEQARLIRNWKQDITKLQLQIGRASHAITVR